MCVWAQKQRLAASISTEELQEGVLHFHSQQMQQLPRLHECLGNTMCEVYEGIYQPAATITPH